MAKPRPRSHTARHRVYEHVVLDGNHYLTRHAWQRMSFYGVSPKDIRQALTYGRQLYTQGCAKYVVGKKDIREAKRTGIDLSHLNGLRVVTETDGAIVTVTINRDFKNLPERYERRRKIQRAKCRRRRRM